jgi:hypothetical protein
VDPKLVRGALALAFAAGCAESRSPFTFSADEGTSEGTSGAPSTGPGEGGPQCVDDSDCGAGYECWGGHCEPLCGLAPAGGVDQVGRGVPVNPACSETDDGWEGDGDGDGDGDSEVCTSAVDCAGGQYCAFGSCFGVGDLPECEAPVFTEGSLPSGTEGPILDLRFVDFDGDGRDSLVLLRAGELLVVEEGLLSSTTVATSLDRITALALDEDGVPDLFLSSASAEEAAFVFGSPDAQLVAVEELGFSKLRDAAALDWIEGGPEELAISSFGAEDGALWLVAQLATMPIELPLEAPAGFETRLEALDFDGDAVAELLVHNGCRFDLLAEVGDINAVDFASEGCSVTKVALLDGGLDSVATLVPGNGVDAVRFLVNGTSNAHVSGLPGAHGRVFAVEIPGWSRQALLASDPDATLLWSSGGETPDCRAAVPALAATTLARSGDLDGDGDSELATVDAPGEARLWSISG